MTRNNPLESLDPAVASLLRDAERKQKIRRLPRNEQKKARLDAARERTIYEVPAELKNAIEEIAGEEGLSPSSVVILLLSDGVRRYRAGQVSFHGLKRPSRSPRYEWVLNADAAEKVLRNGLPAQNKQGEDKATYWL